MSQAILCDKCECRIDGEPVVVLGRDLCQSCAADLESWLETPPKRSRRPHGEPPLDVARRVMARAGIITAELFGAESGQTGRAPYFALKALERTGKLVGVSTPEHAVGFVTADAETSGGTVHDMGARRARSSV